ncbi:shikimate kinase [uncultured Lacinutrix sp.]|uniref:shikimate kinase n=1 Tax=uncultured Lacinutrix sp. TaxID=574032 RepID=UPI0026343DA1|nr:shikimate kinase [uncultured Lacinutrix sp.]
MNLILIGYMASGKSAVGVKLADSLKYDFVDLDNYIESQEKCTIKEIFKNKGELYFRKQEKFCLEKLISEKKNTIISLGGGTPCYYNTINELIDNKTLNTIYLKVSIPELVRRLKNEKNKRPLIAHIESDELLTEFIGKHLFERSQYYNKAEFIVNANLSVEEIIENIIIKLF